MHFPLFYSLGISNDDDNLFCRINKVKTKCGRILESPYKILIENFPITIEPGTSFNITIFGI